MSFMESVRSWLRTCPLIDRQNKFNIGYLGMGADYSLSLAGVTHREDVTGHRRDTWALLFAARLPYGAALTANLTAAELFEDLSAWLLLQEREHNYPQLSGRAAAGTGWADQRRRKRCGGLRAPGTLTKA